GTRPVANLHWTYVGGIERGERNPSWRNVVKLALAVRCRRIGADPPGRRFSRPRLWAHVPRKRSALPTETLSRVTFPRAGRGLTGVRWSGSLRNGKEGSTVRVRRRALVNACKPALDVVCAENMRTHYGHIRGTRDVSRPTAVTADPVTRCRP